MSRWTARIDMRRGDTLSGEPGHSALRMSSAHRRLVRRVRHKPHAAAQGPEPRTNQEDQGRRPGIIYLKDATGATLVELDVELKELSAPTRTKPSQLPARNTFDYAARRTFANFAPCFERLREVGA